MIIRKADLSDALILSETRKKQLIDEGCEVTRNMDGELLEYFKKMLVRSDFIQYIMEDGGKLVSTAAVIFYEFPPSYQNESGLRGYIANVYTDPSYRRHGYAKEILTKLLEDTRARNIPTAWLGASKMGRSLYESIGFSSSDELMEKKL